MSQTHTFLFTDIEGSTKLWERFPEAMKGSLEQHDALMHEAVVESGGKIVKTTGDGLMAVFERPGDGLIACLTALRKLRSAKWGETGPLRVRMGLHLGEAQSRASDYFGPAVNRAARVMAAAHGNQVLLTAVVVQQLASGLPEDATARDLGEHRLKDLERPVHVYQLIHPDIEDYFPPIDSLNVRPNNLPVQTTPFIGRERELSDITHIFSSDSVRLLTLTGPGGTGKTRLALQAAAELVDKFEDGVFLIDLAPYRDAESVIAAIVRTLGLNEKSERSLFDELKDQLGEKEMLLILDNFEQVTVAAVQVADLMRSCANLHLMVTSREALRVHSENLYLVSSLAMPNGHPKPADPADLLRYEAVQLFVSRAKAVKPDFELTIENAEAVIDICQRLDGLPLAIELAAARTRLFSPQALRERLDSRLKLLRGGARDLPQRQQTLRDTIEWSYELLDESERSLFELLSIFSGSTLEAIEAVAEDIDHFVAAELDVYEHVSSLVDKSLIRQYENGSIQPRLGMLGTIKEFAAQRIRMDTELEAAARQAHASYFADFAKIKWAELISYNREEALNDLEADIENIKTAWSYWVAAGEMEQLTKMVDSLWMLYDARGWYQSSVELAGELLGVLSSSPTSLERTQQQIILQTSLARGLMAMQGYTAEVEAAYKRAIELCGSESEIPQLFPVLRGLSSYYTYRAEFDKGAELGEQIVRLAENEADESMLVHGYLVLGSNLGFLNNFHQGLEYLDRGIARYDMQKDQSRRFYLGSSPGLVCHTTSAFFLLWLGFPDRAFSRAKAGIELATRMNHPFTMAYALFHTGTLLLWCKEWDLAAAHAKKLLALVEEQEFPIWKALAHVLHGACVNGLGQTDEGLAQIQQGMGYYQGLTTPPVFWPSIISLQAEALLIAGKPKEGLRLLKTALEPMGLENAIKGLPQLALLNGDLLIADSAQYTAEARSLYQQGLENVRRTEAKMLELLALTRILRIDLRTGGADETGQALKEVYDSFTEGHSLADMKEAKSLLDAWRA